MKTVQRGSDRGARHVPPGGQGAASGLGVGDVRPFEWPVAPATLNVCAPELG